MSLPIPEAISDEECAICISILIKPVTLPCKHELCMSCLGNVLQKFDTCPICHQQFGSELTSSSDLESLVNDKRWTEIRARYPNRVSCRLNNFDTDSEDDALEFALSLSKLTSEEQVQKEVVDEQSECLSADKQPKTKGNKRKRDDFSAPIPRVKVLKTASLRNTRPANIRGTRKVGSKAFVNEPEAKPYLLKAVKRSQMNI